MTTLLIHQFMTPSLHTIGHDQTLAVAHKMMREHAIRHLPVLEGGKLVGIVSQRDLEFIESLKDVDPKQVQVNEAMTPETYTVGPTAELADITAEMAKHKYGCAVVMQAGEVIGIFTTVDALRALSFLLCTPTRPQSSAALD